ncbi:unnamed protein product [Sphagnum compactum]
MPLLKRRPYTVMKPPKDLKPNEEVFQVRFTKEIFRDYQDYLSCMNLYRRRVWTCKVSGKSNLTYEEAVVSERKATEKVQQFPKEFMGPVLHLVQFSCRLRIDELVDRLYKNFKERFVVGEVVVGVREASPCMCRILKILEDEKDGSHQYEVAWLDDDNRRIGTSKESADNLKRKKVPFSRALLKAFVRESASSGPSRNSPWSVHDKHARKYKIALVAPEQIKPKETPSKRTPPSERGRRNEVDETKRQANSQRKRKQTEGGTTEKKGDKKRQHVEKKAIFQQPIQYPIEDSQVKPSPEDPQLADRPVPSTDFILPMECMGDLLMVWDFCCLFSKALHLSPLTIEELEKSLDYTEGEAPLLIEMNFALLRVALTDPIRREEFCHKRKRRIEIMMVNWQDDLCDFLELPNECKFTAHVPTIRQGLYRQLDASVKLKILTELVGCCLSSNAIRTQIDENIEEHQLAAASKREAEVEERKEEQEILKRQRTGNTNGLTLENGDQEGKNLENGREDRDLEGDNTSLLKEESHHQSASVSRSRHMLLKEKVAAKLALEKEKERQRSEEQKKLQEKRKEQAEALAQRKVQEQKLAERLKKQEHLEREMEKHYIRTMPLGKDRFHNRFWFFFREGRLFVESDDCKRWGYYSAKEELDALFNSLNVKGIREKALHKQMETVYGKISTALQKRSKELAQRYAIEEASVRRSERVRTAPRLTGFLAYVNRLRA